MNTILDDYNFYGTDMNCLTQRFIHRYAYMPKPILSTTAKSKNPNTKKCNFVSIKKTHISSSTPKTMSQTSHKNNEPCVYKCQGPQFKRIVTHKNATVRLDNTSPYIVCKKKTR